jgi:hypothetical protein
MASCQLLNRIFAPDDDRRCEHAPQRAWRRHRGPDHEAERDERRYGLQLARRPCYGQGWEGGLPTLAGMQEDGTHLCPPAA